MARMGLTSDAPVVADQLAAAGAVIADLDTVLRAEGTATLSVATIPRRTGHLADTADVLVAGDGFTLTAAAHYAGYVHARDPFFSRAVDARAGEILDAVTDHVDTALSHVGA